MSPIFFLEKQNHQEPLDEMLPKTIEHLVQGPGYQRGGLQKYPRSHWRI